MTAKHADPEYRKNARLIRQHVNSARKRGIEILCWRCGWPIDEEQAFDIGHLNPTEGHNMANLAPEHRGENRRAGGKTGAAIQNLRRARTTGMLPW
ncbi:hypothetical protein [Parafrigoribacterium humi]|jgi:hypothetical protein|uniref:hypothetical protein n=1 Tax=Parafrigoribacterium humi TaxID=3144664 RepID=UPI0032EDA410